MPTRRRQDDHPILLRLNEAIEKTTETMEKILRIGGGGGGGKGSGGNGMVARL